ncbi:metallophosphoesterase [uncultured Pseudokineococcus sp.]|uniref:metallophosphoesterase family protein n=1 Tax=uncultured Pseudokineococcus sp. TaxID=1642928 RepID=UPI002612486C|nr:metallophosphoesterase [uncultured Pseudokineococcus sp.]
MEPARPTSPDRRPSRRTVIGSAATGVAAVAAGSAPAAAAPRVRPALRGPLTLDGPPLLGGPYLLDAGAAGPAVLWHTEEDVAASAVVLGEALADLPLEEVAAAAVGARSLGRGWQRVRATTSTLSRTREDAASRVPGRQWEAMARRLVVQHEARVPGRLPTDRRTPYRVVSVLPDGRATVGDLHTLAPIRRSGAVRLLLTSDHQLKTMTPANLEKVAETVGVELDGVMVAGDLVNVPDRASEWFDDASGLAFFAGLTGRGHQEIAGRTYTGAPLVQHAPLYPAIGNHEVMGRDREPTLGGQFNDPHPRWVAEQRWAAGEGSGEREQWLEDHSWSTTTYEELFPVPASRSGGPRWWSRTIGDVFVVALFATQIWRSKSTAPNVRGTFSEAADDLGDPLEWGYGQHIFERVDRGSEQYRWLEAELASPAARRARYRVVMYHHPAHGLGDNSAPPFTDPVQRVERDADGAVTAVTYDYPLEDDHVLRDLEPLFSAHDVHLVHNGHSHLWNRFVGPTGTNWLETSNVGNSYGAYDESSGRSRALPPDEDHVLQGDPGGLEPVVPTVAPLAGPDGSPLPYVSSNDITAFSVLDSADGVVRSYRFDTREPDGPVVLFDEMPLAPR